MSHYAKIENGMVTQVIVAEQDFIDRMDGEWLKTSHNTRGGVHYKPNSDESDGGVALRMNYAGVGYSYDSVRDTFIPPKPYDSWVLNENTCEWDAPVPVPDNDGFPPDRSYYWDENVTNWVEYWVTD